LYNVIVPTTYYLELDRHLTSFCLTCAYNFKTCVQTLSQYLKKFFCKIHTPRSSLILYDAMVQFGTIQSLLLYSVYSVQCTTVHKGFITYFIHYLHMYITKKWTYVAIWKLIYLIYLIYLGILSLHHLSWRKSYNAQLILARSSNVPFYYIFNVHFVCFLAYYYDIVKCTKNKKKINWHSRQTYVIIILHY